MSREIQIENGQTLVLGEKIGEGLTAEIYPWGEGKVLKLYFAPFGSTYCDYEAEVARALNAAGVPSPKYYGIVSLEGRKGIVFEFVPGVPLLRILQGRSWRLFSVARRLAAEHFRIHSTSARGLPTQVERFRRMIAQSEEILGDLFALLQKKLDGKENPGLVCHGDFHPGNILVSNDHYTAVDWMNAYSGDPASDVARTKSTDGRP